jgi:hypothetical protein
MATEPSDLLLGTICGFTCGNLKFVQVRKDDEANTARKVVRAFLEDREGELKGYEPVASHGGLVALRRRPSLLPSPPVHDLVRPPPPCSELCVCNPVTGKHVSLPPRTLLVPDESFVLLASGDGQFFLHAINLELAVFGVLQVQTYSSVEGRWGGVVPTFAHLPQNFASMFLRPTPILLDGVAYFLCESDSKSLGLYALALPVAGQQRQPAPIRLPDEVQQTHEKLGFKADELLLASSKVNGKRRLTLSVAKGFTISLWTLEDDGDGLVEPARWTRRRLVDLWKIKVLKQRCPPLLQREGDRLALECFSGSSGTVLFHLYCHMLYKLDLQTGDVSLASVYCKRESTNMCAYDTNEAMLKLKC